MNLLTWHGTIARVDRESGARIHAMPWPVRDTADDFDLDLPPVPVSEPTVVAADRPILLQPAPPPPAITLRQDGKYLNADPAHGQILFNRDEGGPWETFLPLPAAAIATLRDIAAHGWTIEETGEAIAPGAWGFEAPFLLTLGSVRIALAASVPQPAPSGDGFVAVATDGTVLHLRRGAALPPRQEIPLGVVHRQDTEAADEFEFRLLPESFLRLQGGTEYNFLPLTVRLAHQDWMHERYWRNTPPLLGPYAASLRVMHDRDKFVMLSNWQEGVLFDERGARSEPGYLFSQHVTSRGMLQREGDRVLIDRAAMDAAPTLSGPTAVFYNGNLPNYYHWVIDALLPLFIMRPYLPPGTRLVLPQTLRDWRDRQGIVDHMAAFAAWGFDDLECVEMPPPLARLEDVYWVDHLEMIHVPAHLLAAARAHVLARVAPRSAPRRIYVRRQKTRIVLNAAEIEDMLEPMGFVTHEMEGASPLQQIELFRDAEFVIAPHGAGLTNLLFCAPGTRVLEIMPDVEYRTAYVEISNKLDLVHAVLPSPTDDGRFFGNMTVDAAALLMLLRQLQNRL
jgi:hypothetical protein